MTFEKVPGPLHENVSMWCLGRLGKFGNQLFQYAFLRIYAQKHDLRYEVPDWIGQTLFDLPDAPLNSDLPPALDTWIKKYAERREFGLQLVKELVYWMAESRTPLVSTPLFGADELANPAARLAGHDLWGTCLFHTQHYRPHKELLRKLYTPKPELETPLIDLTNKLRQKGKTIVGVHIRLGDYWQYPDYSLAFIPSIEWYQTWLRALWPTLDQPVLLLCSDQVERLVPSFREYSPVTSASLSASVVSDFSKRGVGFFPDFYLITQCDILATSHSSFSLTAAMLNQHAKLFVRPIIDEPVLQEFDPWNCDIYADSLDGHIDFSSVTDRFRYRLRNIRRACRLHGAFLVRREFLKRLHLRAAYELGSSSTALLFRLGRLLNRVARYLCGRTVNPIRFIDKQRLFSFFTSRLNK